MLWVKIVFIIFLIIIIWVVWTTRNEKKRVEKELGRKISFEEFSEILKSRQTKPHTTIERQNIESKTTLYTIDTEQYYTDREFLVNLFAEDADILLGAINSYRRYGDMHNYIDECIRIIKFYDELAPSPILKDKATAFQELGKQTPASGANVDYNPNIVKPSKIIQNYKKRMDIRYFEIDIVKKHINEVLRFLKNNPAQTDEDIRNLKDLLESKRFIIDKFPIDILSEKINSTENIEGLFMAISGYETNIQKTTQILSQEPNSIEFQNKNFVLTGQFMYVDRQKLQQHILTKGGNVSEEVQDNTHYLILGTLADERYTYLSFGRKFERSVDYNKQGIANITIISEEWLIRFL